MTVINPAFVATPAQEKFFAAAFSGEYKYLGYGGGIRGGKSYAGIGLLILLAKVFPRSRWAIVRKDLPTLRRNVLPTLSKLRDTCGSFLGDVNQGSWTVPCSNGSELVLFAESLKDDPELNRWRGLEVNGFDLEEGNELQEQSFSKAIERAGSWIIPGLKVQPPPLIIVTFNPSPGWVKRKFYDPWRAGTLQAPFYYQPATVLDNPYLPQAYLDSLKQMNERDYKRFVEGDWSFIAGSFFDELAADTHLCPRLDEPGLPDPWAKLPSWWRYWGAYDWGFRHPAVFMGFAQDGDGNVYVLDTVRCYRLDDVEQAQRVAEAMPGPVKSAGAYAGHDVEAVRRAHVTSHETVADVFFKHGIRLTKANIGRKPGWAVVRRMLSRKSGDGKVREPRLKFCDTPGNRWAIERIMELQPDEGDADDVQKVDANQDGEGGDDAGDCLRYGLASATWLPQEPVAARPTFIFGDNPDSRSRPKIVLDTNQISDDPDGASYGAEGSMGRMGAGW